jgi:DNA polymerase-3 subunit epsilon
VSEPHAPHQPNLLDDKWLAELAQRLALAAPLTFLDLEATGPFPESDRIIEIAAITLHPDGRVVRYQTLVNPEQPSPADATKVHGLTDEDVRDAPKFRSLANGLHRALIGRDIGGFNVGRYDLKLLAAEFRRLGMMYEPEQVRVVDVMRIFHLNEKRDLTAAVRFYLGQQHDGHRAIRDVEATIAVLGAQLDKYPLPATVGELESYCRNQSPEWLTRDGRIAWRNDLPCITFGRHAGLSLQLLASEQSEYLRWILESEFAPDVKRLISEALEGRFPEPVVKAPSAG